MHLNAGCMAPLKLYHVAVGVCSRSIAAIVAVIESSQEVQQGLLPLHQGGSLVGWACHPGIGPCGCSSWALGIRPRVPCAASCTADLGALAHHDQGDDTGDNGHTRDRANDDPSNVATAELVGLTVSAAIGWGWANRWRGHS